jgi:hypothetical protein
MYMDGRNMQSRILRVALVSTTLFTEREIQKCFDRNDDALLPCFEQTQDLTLYYCLHNTLTPLQIY